MTSLARDPSDDIRTDSVAGCEWIVDASGCPSPLLRSLETLQQVFDRIVRELDLQVICLPLWRQFPDPGGVTGLSLLSESHLACHTWPEHGIATFNLFCCRRRREWPWESRLREMLLAETVSIRMLERGSVMTTTVDVVAAGDPI